MLLTKYPYVIHAEHDAIFNLLKYNSTLLTTHRPILFTSLFPCSNCAKLIVTAGIDTIFYLDDKYEGTEDNLAAKILLKECNIEFYKI